MCTRVALVLIGLCSFQINTLTGQEYSPLNTEVKRIRNEFNNEPQTTIQERQIARVRVEWLRARGVISEKCTLQCNEENNSGRSGPLVPDKGIVQKSTTFFQCSTSARLYAIKAGTKHFQAPPDLILMVVKIFANLVIWGWLAKESRPIFAPAGTHAVFAPSVGGRFLKNTADPAPEPAHLRRRAPPRRPPLCSTPPTAGRRTPRPRAGGRGASRRATPPCPGAGRPARPGPPAAPGGRR